MDIWVTTGMPKPHLPHVPGEGGVGVGADVRGIAEGDEVVLNPAVACGSCSQCLRGESPLCAEFGILGEHRWGTHGPLVVVPARNVKPRPAGRTWEETAAYPLCAL